MNKTNIKSKIISLTIAVLMIITSIPINTILAASSDIESGGSQFEGAFGKIGDYTIGSNDYGVKVSLIAIELKNNVSQYKRGILRTKTPMGSYVGDTSKPTETVGTYPVLYTKNSIKNEAFITENGLSSINANNYIVTDNDYAGVSNIIKEKIKKAFIQNWYGAVAQDHINTSLGIVKIKEQGKNKEQELHNIEVIKALAKITQNKYTAPTTEVKKALDKLSSTGIGIIDDTEYLFLVEPVQQLNGNGKQHLITPLNMCQYYLLGSGSKDIRKMQNLGEALVKIKNTQLYKNDSNPVSGWRFAFDGFIGWDLDGYNNMHPTKNTGTVAYKVSYNGPTGNGREATKSDSKWGYGIIYPQDYAPIEDLALKVHYGIMDIANGSSNTHSAQVTLNKFENTTAILG